MFRSPFLRGRSLCIIVIFFLVAAWNAQSAIAQLTDEVLYRVNAGGPAIDDWEEDTDALSSPYLLAGSASIETSVLTPFITPSVPAGTPTDLFNSLRLDADQPLPQMEWDFPVTAGEALIVRLYFIEWTRCSQENRVFDVEIEGVIVLNDLDVFGYMGDKCNRAYMRSFKVTPADNNLDIDFPLVNGKPSSLAGIEILSDAVVDPTEVIRIAGNGSPGYTGDGGPAIDAEVKDPHGMLIDENGNIYVADRANHVIRLIDAATGNISTVAGTGVGGYSGDNGLAIDAQLNNPYEIKYGPDGNLYIADQSNHRIRMIDVSTGIISTVAGNGGFGYGGDGGLAVNATFFWPNSIAFDAAGNLYIADTNNDRIRKVDASTNIIDTVVGTGVGGFSGDGGLAIDAQIDVPLSLVFDEAGHLYFTGSNRVRRVDGGTGIINTVAGDGSSSSGGDGGIATNAQIHGPRSIAFDHIGAMYITEITPSHIRRVDPATNIISTIEAADEFAYIPLGIMTVEEDVYFTNQEHDTVYKIDFESSVGNPSTLTVSPPSIDFGWIDSGASSSPETISLTNIGDDLIDVTSVSISGTDSGDFTHDFAGPVTIASNTSSTFTVTFAPDPPPLPPPPPFTSEDVLYRVNAGGSLVDDWDEDTDATASPYLVPGTASIETSDETPTIDASVPAGTPLDLFKSKRRDADRPDPKMLWRFPVTREQEYEVRLYFAELSRCSIDNRVFHVEIDGVRMLSSFDVFEEAGDCNVGIMRSKTVTPAEDTLNIEFILANFKPSIVSAIEILGPPVATTSPRSAQLTVEHTGTNGPLTVDLAGTAVLSGGTGNQPPVAAFTPFTAILDVIFNDESTDSDGTITAWSWDFGDGVSSTEQSPLHSYAAAGTYTVTLTVTDDDGASDSVSDDITVTAPSGGIVVSLPDVTRDIGSAEDITVTVTDVTGEGITSYEFTLTYDPAILSITGVDTTGTVSGVANPVINTTTPGQIVVVLASAQPLTGSGPLIHLNVDLLSAGVSTLTFTEFTFNEGNPSLTTIDGSIDVTDTGETGPFLEAGGQVVMEAENFDTNIARNVHAWTDWTAEAGFSGASSMSAQPNTGVVYKKASVGESPEMQYNVEFSTTGSYYVWVRVFAESDDDNTLHMGLESVASASKIEAGEEGIWTWTNVNTKGKSVTMGVTDAGLHTVNLWMREDGIIVDKIVLTTNAGFVPTGTGPEESPRGGAASKQGPSATDVLLQTATEIPDEFALGANYPNPFNPTTTIAFALPEAADVRLEVFDAMGRRVATLANGSYSAGHHESQWNARTDAGEPVASGIYLYRLRAGSFEAVGRMVLMK